MSQEVIGSKEGPTTFFFLAKEHPVKLPSKYLCFYHYINVTVNLDQRTSDCVGQQLIQRFGYDQITENK